MHSTSVTPTNAEATPRSTHDTLTELLARHAPTLNAPDATLHDMTQPHALHGRDAIAAYLSVFYAGAFEDVHVEPRTRLTSGEHAVLEFVFRGRHVGAQLGFPATHRSVELHLVALYEVRHGFVQSARLYYDSAELPRQLGVQS